jgi:hypothetical protein
LHNASTQQQQRKKDTKMKRVHRLDAVIEMAKTIRHGIEDGTMPNDYAIGKAVKGAYESLIAEFDEGEILGELQSGRITPTTGVHPPIYGE